MNVKTLNAILKSAPRLKDVALRGIIRDQGKWAVKSLILDCPNIRLLSIKDLEYSEELEVRGREQVET